jgi:hypothetical protein
VLAEANEPLPIRATITPSWATALTPEQVERFISVTESRRGGLMLRLLLKPTKKKEAERDCMQAITVALLLPVIRNMPEVVQLVEKVMH